MKRNTRLIVIGGVAAGTKAASKARRESPDMEITIFTDGEYISYAGCGLPYYIGGLSPREKLFARTVKDFQEKQGIKVFTGHKVQRIDTYDRFVSVCDISSGSTINKSYDKLMIATGAIPVIPDIAGTELKGVFTLHTIPDADAIIKYIEDNKPSKAVVIGGGYIGLETAENLKMRGIEVTIIELSGKVLTKMLDPEMSDIIQSHLLKKGIRLITGTKAQSINPGGDGKVSSVSIKDEKIECGIVIMAAGITPNTVLARDARIAIGETGAIKVDRYMETSVKGIYAAGDCAESVNMVSGKPCWVPLGSTANKQGRVAGSNIAGNKKSFPGVLGTSIVKVFDLAAGKTGLTEWEAHSSGFNPVSAVINAGTKAGYYPGGGTVSLKLIADRASGRVLGAQMIGSDTVDKLTDTFAAVLAGKQTVDDIANIDIAYSPPFSQALGAVIQAAHVLEEKL